MKEPLKLWAKPLKNGNKALYIRRYVPGSNSKQYEYERLKGMFLVDDKQGKDKMARAQNQATMKTATLMLYERITNFKDGRERAKASQDLLLKDWMQIYATKKRQQGQSDSHAKNIHHTMLHLIIYKGTATMMSQVDASYCKGFVSYLSQAKTIGTSAPKRGEHHKKPMAVSTAKLYFNTLVSALNEAVREGIIPINPTTLLRKEDKKMIFRKSNTRPYLNIEEIKRLVATPCKDERVKRAFLFACFCGLRISDVKSLKWSDIQEGMEGSYICKQMVKTRLMVMVPLSEKALAWMPKRTKGKADELVFHLPSYCSINHRIKQWSKAARIEKPVSFHVARHSFATTLLTMGADLYTTSKLLGHQNISTTQIYAEIVNKKKVEAIKLLDKISSV